jgi:hypothetical protein
MVIDTPEMEGKWELSETPEGQGPLVIIVPGLSGTSHEKYLTSACREFWNSPLKARTMIANRRGYTGLEIKGDYPMSWIRWEDIEAIVYWLRTVRKEKEIFIYGASLGGNYAHWHSGRIAELENGAELRKDFGEGHLVDDYPHLIEAGHEKGTRVSSLGPLSKIDGYMAISAPFCMQSSVKRLEKSMIIDAALKGGLSTTCKSHVHNPLFLKALDKMGINKGKISLKLLFSDFNDFGRCIRHNQELERL